MGGDWKYQIVKYSGFSDWYWYDFIHSWWSRYEWASSINRFYWAWLSIPISYEEFCERCQESSWISSRSLRRDKGVSQTIEPEWLITDEDSGLDLKEFWKWKSRYDWYQDHYLRLLNFGN